MIDSSYIDELDELIDELLKKAKVVRMQLTLAEERIDQFNEMKAWIIGMDMEEQWHEQTEYRYHDDTTT